VTSPIDLPQGTLDLLVLRTVALEPLHGWGITFRITQLSKGTVDVGHGSLYPALHRLERRGLLRARWRVTDNNRRAKYYEITRTGQKHLDREADGWRRLAAAISAILGEA
jgi:PadR family transcriptional regulator PadR